MHHRSIVSLLAAIVVVLLIAIACLVEQQPQQHDSYINQLPPKLRPKSNTIPERAVLPLDLRDPTDKLAGLTHNITSFLQPRRAPNAFSKAQTRGRELLKYLNDPSTAPRSKFIDFHDLGDWGWERKTGIDVRAHLEPLRWVFQEKGLSMVEPQNVDWSWDHSKQTVHDVRGQRITFPPSGGDYDNIFNPEQGVIIAYNSHSPASIVAQNKHRPSPPGTSPLPQLEHWSDVVYLTWAHITSQAARKNLRYVFHYNTFEPQPTDVTAKALKMVGLKSGQPPPWPGHTFTYTPRSRRSILPSKTDKANKAFEAMLGTPDVGGVALMLVQHFEAMGRKKVGWITVFTVKGMGGVGDWPVVMVELV